MLYDLQIKQTEVKVTQKQKWENIVEKHDIEWKAIFNLTFELLWTIKSEILTTNI